ncbi:uncharacterized protein LOC120358105 [Solenopsis invicta]|uniref:uncharacterized protein LOC120358105 n=1 Tax=Solenopsis invicta TaxID=13686 RepID=UPI00193E7320|nr:uncharacterized protein LOC120358105 [Solenopsis invicta]
MKLNFYCLDLDCPGLPSKLGPPSLKYSSYYDQKKCVLERFPQDLSKYVALKDLFISQDKYVKSTLTNREQPYELFYDLGLTADCSFIDGNSCKNMDREFDTTQITNYKIGRTLNTINTINGTNISDLNIKLPLHSLDQMHNEKNATSARIVKTFEHPHPGYATPSPSSYALAKRQVVTRPIRIRPTSWFKESRG